MAHARRRGPSLIAVGALLALGASACTGSSTPATPTLTGPTSAVSSLPPGPSWAPAPVAVGSARAVATTSGTTFALHTKHGDVSFVPGMNLGATTPGHYPGEVAIEATDYRRWFAQMGAMGIRAVRIYTIHRPDFYTELLAYNTLHPDAPLYLVQGVYPPDESYVTTQNVFDPGPTKAFDSELRDAVAAVTGTLARDPVRGHADGHWTADVSAYVMGWTIGAEMDPAATQASDARNTRQPGFKGTYFGSTAQASPTERWLAARLDGVAGELTKIGTLAPLAFVNWPTTDPLRHPSEPIPAEDLVGIDANNVQPTSAWRGGYFASYHAYPYYPDFQRHQPDYQSAVYAGRKDPYAGYLRDLKAHHGTMPIIVSEFGVPSSVGAAHFGPLGRDQGNHSEQESMAIDAELLKEIKNLGLAGGFVFEWTDEWFKATWNTFKRQLPVDRRALWHDPWTNEQWFGVVAADPAERSPEQRLGVATAGVRSVDVARDQAWLFLTVRTDAAKTPVVLGFDVLPGPGEPTQLPAGAGANNGSDVVVVADASGVHQLERSDQDGRALDGKGVVIDLTPGTWAVQNLTTNRALTLPTAGEKLPAEYLPVGDLREGDWTPGSPSADSRAQYRYTDGGTTLLLRLPWESLLLSDPSSRTALRIKGVGQAAVENIPGITIRALAGGLQVEGFYTWDTWTRALYTERVKDGADLLAKAFGDTGSG